MKRVLSTIMLLVALVCLGYRLLHKKELNNKPTDKKTVQSNIQSPLSEIVDQKSGTETEEAKGEITVLEKSIEEQSFTLQSSHEDASIDFVHKKYGRGFDETSPVKVTGWEKPALTPLMEATVKNDLEGIKNLLKLKSVREDINQEDTTYGMSPLHWATELNRAEAVDLLLKNGAQIDKVIEKQTYPYPGWTALQVASYWGYKETVEVILKYQPNCNKKVQKGSKKGMTPLHLLLLNSAYKHKEVLNLLLKAGAQVDEKNNQGLTPLHKAIMMHQTSNVQTLLKNGAKLQIKVGKGTYLGANCLELAKKLGYEEMAELLERHQNTKP